MAVTADFRLTFLPFRQGGGPLPAGIWTAQGSVVGDASGGDAFVNFNVVELTEPFTALMLTVEQIELTDDDSGNTKSVLLEATGFEEHDPDANRNVLFHFRQSAGPTGATAMFSEDTLKKPIFLGRCDRTSGQDSRIRLIWNNVTTIRFRAALFGYFWTPEAMNSQGGPVRPLGTLFGN